MLRILHQENLKPTDMVTTILLRNGDEFIIIVGGVGEAEVLEHFTRAEVLESVQVSADQVDEIIESMILVVKTYTETQVTSVSA